MRISLIILLLAYTHLDTVADSYIFRDNHLVQFSAMAWGGRASDFV